MEERISYQQVPGELIGAMMQIESYLKQSGLDEKLLNLMRYYVSQLNGCAYCLDMHFKEAFAGGEEDVRLHSVAAWRETDYYSDREQAVLAWAETVTKLDKNPGQQTLEFDELRQYFSLEQIAQLTLAITQINSWNRLVKAFHFRPGRYQAARDKLEH
ncbi:carboxymuconolactone decarboxylase family protein [Thalassomonas sp. RHCl1]|uniref:carboxymuconolactone decarboxylase family protein n=1 Tax=Thalassomonas sp. RHCl1 TaxID=2995320 RepID=UPI00248B653D|nr:carboxymuconolactone decarboxylase family protein [Thalassomonas sp. RHCl1]